MGKVSSLDVDSVIIPWEAKPVKVNLHNDREILHSLYFVELGTPLMNKPRVQLVENDCDALETRRMKLVDITAVTVLRCH